jgi:hypothetical protein
MRAAKQLGPRDQKPFVEFGEEILPSDEAATLGAARNTWALSHSGQEHWEQTSLIIIRRLPNRKEIAG